MSQSAQVRPPCVDLHFGSLVPGTSSLPGGTLYLGGAMGGTRTALVGSGLELVLTSTRHWPRSRRDRDTPAPDRSRAFELTPTEAGGRVSTSGSTCGPAGGRAADVGCRRSAEARRHFSRPRHDPVPRCRAETPFTAVP